MRMIAVSDLGSVVESDLNATVAYERGAFVAYMWILKMMCILVFEKVSIEDIAVTVRTDGLGYMQQVDGLESGESMQYKVPVLAFADEGKYIQSDICI